MRRLRIIGGIAVVLAAALSVTSVTSASGGGWGFGRASLTTVEGIVRSIESVPGEGGGPLDVARISTDEPESRELSVVLAPKEALQQIGFELQVGDRLKARVFLSDDQPVFAHKVMNLTRGTMVRLRSLTRIPLWDGKGQWQGGPCRSHRGGAGHHGSHR